MTVPTRVLAAFIVGCLFGGVAFAVLTGEAIYGLVRHRPARHTGPYVYFHRPHHSQPPGR